MGLNCSGLSGNNDCAPHRYNSCGLRFHHCNCGLRDSSHLNASWLGLNLYPISCEKTSSSASEETLDDIESEPNPDEHSNPGKAIHNPPMVLRGTKKCVHFVSAVASSFTADTFMHQPTAMEIGLSDRIGTVIAGAHIRGALIAVNPSLYPVRQTILITTSRESQANSSKFVIWSQLATQSCPP